MTLNDKYLMKRLNRQLGTLCLLLVPLSVGFGILGIDKVNQPDFWYSVSDTFYANSNIWMIGLLFATSIFFFSYKGYDKIDWFITKVSGVAAFGVITFPCYSPAALNYTGLLVLDPSISHIFHCASAITLFISFAVMIGFRFPRTSGNMTRRKKIRNIIYYVSASIIVIFMINQIVTSVIGIAWFTIINEFFILTAFGIAWLVKGETFKFLNDEEEG